MSIAKNLRRLRTAAGLTQKQLAEQAGISEISVRYYESGRHQPKTEALYRLSSVLRCSPDDLLEWPLHLPGGIFSDKIPTIYTESAIQKSFPEDDNTATFIQYLKSLGYRVIMHKKSPSSDSSKNDYCVTIKCHGQSMKLNQKEFLELHSNVSRIIQYELYRQAQTQPEQP